MKPAAARAARVGVTVVIVAALVMFARSVNWHATWQSIAHTHRWVLVAATLVNLASLGVKGIRWWVFLRPIGAPSLPLAIRATFAGAGLNNVLVANGGEAARVVFIARATRLPSERVLATLALERMFELMGYVLILALSASFLELPPTVARFRPLAWVALAGTGVLWVHLVRQPEHVQDLIAPLATGWWARARSYGVRFMRTVGGISTGPRFSVALVLSVAAWAMQVWTYALTARSAGFDLPLVGTLAAILAVNLGFALRLTPGNVGVFQVMYALIASAFGMDRNQAIAVALLIQIQQILPVTFIGVALAPEFLLRRAGPGKELA